ncbi:MAG: hypothetical protein QNL58_12100 [Octadecabacter sp.]
MAFEILSALTLGDAPADGVATNISNLTAPSVPNVDALGGTAEVIGSLDGGAATIRYTDVNGMTSDSVVELQEGFSLTSAQGVVIDAENSTFTFAISGPSEVTDGTVAGIFNVFIDGAGDGTVGATESFPLEFETFVDEETGETVFQQSFPAPLDLQPLGNGQLAFYSPNGNAGAVSLDETNSPLVTSLVLASGDLDLDTHTLGLGDGQPRLQ